MINVPKRKRDIFRKKPGLCVNQIASAGIAWTIAADAHYYPTATTARINPAFPIDHLLRQNGPAGS
jgi:hypothetical protein